jgi:WD40 repeat protein
VDICFEHLCSYDLVDFFFLIRWCRVSQEWMDALKRALPSLRRVSFPVGVTGEDVLRALGLVAATRQTDPQCPRKLFVDLRGCLISAEHMASIVALVCEISPGAKEINIEGCSDWAVVRAVAECLAETLGISSSRELYQRIKEMGNGERCAFPRLLDRLQEGPGPRLALDREFKPDAEPQSDEDSDGEEDFSSRILARFTDGGETGHVCAKVMAVLLGVSFDDDKFQCSTSQLHDAAARGDTELVSLLLDAGADINEANEQGDTALLLACRAGLLKLATRLKDAGANVSVANNQGDTALLAAVTVGNLELAELLVSWGADVKAQRRDGAGIIALAIHSKRPDSISFALRHGPERIASQSTFDTVALAQAYVSPRNIQRWLLAGASPLALALEIGALLLHPKVDAGRLDDMRALLHRHKELLQDTAKWPVPHVVEQLAAQDLGASVQHDETDDSGEGMCRLIECITPSSATGEYGRLVNAQACRWSIEGDSEVRSVAFSPDMLKLARGEGNHAIVCCAVSGLEFRRLVGHRGWVRTVAFAFDGKVLASGGDDSRIILWDPKKGEHLKTLEGHSGLINDVRFSLDGTMLVSCSGSWREHDNSVRLWDVGTGKELKKLEGHSGYVLCVEWAPDGSQLVSGGEYGEIKLWSPTGECLNTLKGHSNWVVSVAWSINGLLASGSCDKTVKIWNPSAGECLKTLEGHSDCAKTVAFSFDGKVLASGGDDSRIILWDPKKGERLTEFKGHSDYVNCVHFNPTNPRQLVSGSDDKTVRLWDVDSGKELKKLEGHSDLVWTVAFSFDGKVLASGGDDSRIILWDPEKGERLKTLEGHSGAVLCVEWAPDGSLLVSGGGRGDNKIKLWSPTGKCLNTLEGHSDCVKTVAFSFDGKVLAGGGDDRRIILWDPKKGERLTELKGHRNSVKKVEFEQDGATLVSSDGAETIWWDVATGARKDKVAGQFAFAKATNGRYIVTQKDDLIFVYDTRGGVVIADGEEKVPIAFFRAPSPVVSICCAGDKVAVGCQSGAVLLHAAWLTDGGAA